VVLIVIGANPSGSIMAYIILSPVVGKYLCEYFQRMIKNKIHQLKSITKLIKRLSLIN
jgi:predicted Na+-dependent transporter